MVLGAWGSEEGNQPLCCIEKKSWCVTCKAKATFCSSLEMGNWKKSLAAVTELQSEETWSNGNRMKLKIVQGRHWQSGREHWGSSAFFSPYCLICNRWSVKDFILVFLEKAVLISQVAFSTRLYVLTPAVCLWESREIDTHNRKMAELSWKHALSSQTDKKLPSTAAQAVFVLGNLGVIPTPWFQMYHFAPFLHWVRWRPRLHLS